jgi:hypothetical protein
MVLMVATGGQLLKSWTNMFGNLFKRLATGRAAGGTQKFIFEMALNQPINFTE